PILRWGMVLSMVMMLVGLTLGVISGTESTKALSLERIPSGILELEPMAFLSLGIVLLIVTPLARVFGALCVFIREGDRKFILISLVVLTAVTVAVLLGAA
ncbi:MAG: DUF1634 domain-containing protein, partial [Methanomassiliicoccales archaeon]|nr:DUF1634 domain-containing protein [Methanomassiliicoccales archaeon]